MEGLVCKKIMKKTIERNGEDIKESSENDLIWSLGVIFGPRFMHETYSEQWGEVVRTFELSKSVKKWERDKDFEFLISIFL